MAEAILYTIFLILLGIAAVSDLRARVIPNRYPVAVAAAFLPLAALGAVPAWPGHLLVFAAVFAACLALFAAGLLGGGDAKLLPAAALWAGPSTLAEFLLVTAVTGGAIALTLAIKAKWAGRRRSPMESEAAPRPDMPHGGSEAAADEAEPGAMAPASGEVPYAPAIAAGGLVVALEPLLNALSANSGLVPGNGV